MEKKYAQLSDYEVLAIILFFMLGTASLLVRGVAAGKDAWLACIIATIASMFLGVVLVSLNNLHTDKQIFEVIECVLGKVIGKIIIVCYLFYGFITAPLIIRDIGEFLRISVLNNTPLEISMLLIVFLGVYVLKGGLEVLGLWCRLFMGPLVVIFLLVMLSVIPQMDLINILPIANQPMGTIFEGVYEAFLFPLGESVIFMTFLISTKDTERNYKRLLKPLILSGIVVSAISLTNILILGIGIASATYFPTLAVLRISDIGLFLKRLEILIALVFIMGTFVKVTLYLFFLAKGFQTFFNLKDYRELTTPIGILTVLLSTIMFKSAKEFFEWDNQIWPFIGLVFQTIIPLIILIIGIGKNKLLPKKKFSKK